MERIVRRMIAFKTFRNTKRDRMPTRQPDPSVFNRNALLARENRRKKKAHLEILEKNLQEALKTNKKLLKELGKQLKNVKKLEQEKMYYRSILIKQPKIQRLLTALNYSLDHNSKYNINLDYNQQELLKAETRAHEDSMCSQYSSSVDELEGSTLSSETFNVSGVAKTIIEQDLFLPSYQSSPSLSYESFTDSEPLSLFNNWNVLYDTKDQSVMKEIHQNDKAAEPPLSKDFSMNNVNISDDHNYFFSSDEYKPSDEGDVGFCVHIGENQVTLDFCQSCHLNARCASNNMC